MVDDDEEDDDDDEDECVKWTPASPLLNVPASVLIIALEPILPPIAAPTLHPELPA